MRAASVQNLSLRHPDSRRKALGISLYLATAANAFDHAVKRRVLAIDWIVRITHQVLLRGHLIRARLAVPDGASGSSCPTEFVDRGATGFREPDVCAIATEVSTKASNAIVVISFRMMDLAS